MKKNIYPESLTKFLDLFVHHYLNTLKRSKTRTNQIKTSVYNLYTFMCQKHLSDISHLSAKHIIGFQYFLYQHKQYSGITVFRHLQRLDLFCRYLLHHDYIWKNPFADITYAKLAHLETKEITRYYNFDELLNRWSNWMKKRGEHIVRVKSKLRNLSIFIGFLQEQGIKSVYKVTPELLKQFTAYLIHFHYKPGLLYNRKSQVVVVRQVCSFFLYLHRQKLIRSDPGQHMKLKEYYKELDLQYRSQHCPNPLSKPKLPYVSNSEINKLLEKFLEYSLARGRSKNTIHNYVDSVKHLYNFMQSRNINDLRVLRKSDLMDFQTWLANILNHKDVKYSPNSVLRMLICLRGFFKYLMRYDYLACDHMSGLELPKAEHGIPHTCMTEREVKLLLEQPNIISAIGLRDRAILEVLYSTGIRVNELVNLKIPDIDFSKGLCRVNTPKGGKSYQRIVPIGRLACFYVKEYLSKVRPVLDVFTNSNNYLFLSCNGRQLYCSAVNTMIKKYLFHSGLRKNISTHSFRVTCATHMLTHRADIRYVQQQLGHRSIRTTQGYTRLVPKDLKVVHTRCHPREKKLVSVE